MEKLTYTHNDAAAKALAAFYETPPLAYVRSYGCQQNVNDGEKIKGVLQDVGYGLCDNVEHADLILFNTCAVREHAEQRVFGNVGALKKLKEQNPRLMIGVCGCMAQQEHIVEKLRQSYPYVDLVFGVDGIDRLPAMLAERIRKGKRYLEKPAERNAVMNMAIHGERVIDTLVCYGPYSGVPCAECRQVIWEFCDNNPDVRIIGATTEGEIELMTIGEIYPYPYGPATKGIDCKEY